MASETNSVVPELATSGGTDENTNIGTGGGPTNATLNGSDEKKIQIDSDDDMKAGNEDEWSNGDDNGCAGEEDAMTKPLTIPEYGYPGGNMKMIDEMELSQSRPSRFKDVLAKQMRQTKKRETPLVLFVLFLFIVIIAGLVVIYHLHSEDLYYIYHNHVITLHKSQLHVNFKNADGEVVLTGNLWKNSPPRGKPYDCSEGGHGESNDRGSLCLLWKNVRRLEVEHFELDHSSCHRIQWHFLSQGASGNSDCYDLGQGVKWFGGGILKNFSGTLDAASIRRQPFLTASLHDPGAFGPVVDGLFLSSKGVAILADSNSSFELSVNGFDESLGAVDQQLCLHTTSHSVHGSNEFAYLVCIGDTIGQVRTDVLSILVSNPAPSVPPGDIFNTQIWSTWAYFKEHYNETSLIHFADQIANRTFHQRGLLMIDDGWEVETGDLEFMTSKFADPTAMVDTLHGKHFQVSFVFRAQISTKSAAFQNTTIQEHLVQTLGGEVPGLTHWWNGPHEPEWDRGLAGMYDLTDEEAAEMLRGRLRRLQEMYHIDAFHVAGTEAAALPTYSATKSAVADPNEYTRRGVEMAADFGALSSAESAFRSQNFSVMIRLRGGTSTWDGVGGLQSVIPTALTLGMLGYPLFISDSVGGSAYDVFPSKELFIRWFQVAAFLPIMHFSVPPWHYDNETQAVVDDILRVRENLVLPEIRSVIMDPSGPIQSPIVRPIWWVDPSDKEALDVITEFLVGDNILVAPIIEEGVDRRDIYLPRGLWRDPLLGVNHSGPRWLRAYVSPLTNVAYFIRQ